MTWESSAVSGGLLAAPSPSFQQTHWDWDAFIEALPHGWSNIFSDEFNSCRSFVGCCELDQKYYPCSICSLKGGGGRHDFVKQSWSQLSTFKGVGESSTIPKYNLNARINDPVVVGEVRKTLLSVSLSGLIAWDFWTHFYFFFFNDSQLEPPEVSVEISMSAIHWAAWVESTSSCVFVGQNMAQKAFDQIFLKYIFPTADWLLCLHFSSFSFIILRIDLIFPLLKKTKNRQFFLWMGIQMFHYSEKPGVLFF